MARKFILAIAAFFGVFCCGLGLHLMFGPGILVSESLAAPTQESLRHRGSFISRRDMAWR